MVPHRRRALLLVGVGVVVAIRVLTSVLLLYRPTESAGSHYLQLAAIDVGFSGSGATNATAVGVCSACPESLAVGSTTGMFFTVQVPAGAGCARQYSISQLQGPTTGGLVITNGTGTDPEGVRGFPVTVPQCQGSYEGFGATIYFDVTAYDVEPPAQTLDLTVVVNEVS